MGEKMLLNGMKIFMLEAWKLPVWVRLWLMVLMGVNGVWACMFLGQLAAQVSILALMVGACVGFIMCDISGFNKYLGLMHAAWVPLAYMNGRILYLEAEYGLEVAPDFKMWVMASFAVTCLSLLMDIADVTQYRKEKQTS